MIASMSLADAAARIAAAGRAAWPGVALANDAIAAHLEARLRDDPDARADDLHDADLYLAIALGAGDAAALRAFEARLVPEIDRALRRLRLSAATLDEIKQQLRLELFAGESAKIRDYAGRGELVAWLRVTATRKGWRFARRGAVETTLDEILLDHWPAATPDPKHQHLRATYVDELKRAIADAFAALELRQRNLLRQHVIDELTIDDLARLYRVHRATCARWLADARTELGKSTRKRLVATLGLPGDELDSLLRFLDSDIELSISRILQAR
jgi:RNA polymerase sigma-70 factor (ECF subfamily)